VIVKSFLVALVLVFGPILHTQAIADEAMNGQYWSRSDHSAEPSSASPAVSQGWNYYHVESCYSNGGALYVITEEIVLAVTNTVALVTLAPACQTGNWIAVYIDGSFYTQIFAYPWS
jgi:hypothetical protein